MKIYDVRVTNLRSGSTYVQPVVAKSTSDAKRQVGSAKDYRFHSVAARPPG